jgi:hypothetical protein
LRTLCIVLMLPVVLGSGCKNQSRAQKDAEAAVTHGILPELKAPIKGLRMIAAPVAFGASSGGRPWWMIMLLNPRAEDFSYSIYNATINGKPIRVSLMLRRRMATGWECISYEAGDPEYMPSNDLLTSAAARIQSLRGKPLDLKLEGTRHFNIYDTNLKPIKYRDQFFFSPESNSAPSTGTVYSLFQVRDRSGTNYYDDVTTFPLLYLSKDMIRIPFRTKEQKK